MTVSPETKSDTERFKTKWMKILGGEVDLHPVPKIKCGLYYTPCNQSKEDDEDSVVITSEIRTDFQPTQTQSRNTPTGMEAEMSRKSQQDMEVDQSLSPVFLEPHYDDKKGVFVLGSVDEANQLFLISLQLVYAKNLDKVQSNNSWNFVAHLDFLLICCSHAACDIPRYLSRISIILLSELFSKFHNQDLQF